MNEAITIKGLTSFRAVSRLVRTVSEEDNPLPLGHLKSPCFALETVSAKTMAAVGNLQILC